MKAILSILVMLGIPAAFWNYYLKESPDVQYSLSAAIPLAFQELSKDSKDRQTSDEFVQQIEVANSGKGEAKKIVVKIPKAIIQYHLAKHSESEPVEIFKTSGTFELNYPSLPAANRFQITLKTSGAPLTESQLELFHQGGKAKIVSPGSRSGDTFWYVWMLLCLFYIWLIYVSARDEFKYRFLFQRYSTDVEKLLRNEKPWYIRQKDWPDVVDDLLKRALSEPVSLYSAISNSAPFKFLSSDKPSAISQSTWDKLTSTASELLLAAAKSQAKQFSTTAEIFDLLNIQWPDGLTEANKEALMKSISGVYLDRILDSSVEGLVKILTEDQKPPKTSTDAWERFKEKATREIAKSLSFKLMYEDDVDAIANSPAWKVISDWDRSKLSKLLSGRMAEVDASEKLKESKELNEKLSSLESQLKSRELAVAASENHNLTLRAKVHRQLDAIERVITDPAYLNRIEPDDDTFVAGNWALLKGLATKN